MALLIWHSRTMRCGAGCPPARRARTQAPDRPLARAAHAGNRGAQERQKTHDLGHVHVSGKPSCSAVCAMPLTRHAGCRGKIVTSVTSAPLPCDCIVWGGMVRGEPRPPQPPRAGPSEIRHPRVHQTSSVVTRACTSWPPLVTGSCCCGRWIRSREKWQQNGCAAVRAERTLARGAACVQWRGADGQPARGAGVTLRQVNTGAAVREYSCLQFAPDRELLFAGTRSGDVLCINVRQRVTPLPASPCPAARRRLTL